jgi:hypothetical protein
MLEKFIENYLMKSRIAQQTDVEHLLAGRCKDYADYKQAIGRIQGFKKAEDLVRSLYSLMIEHVDIKHKEIQHGTEAEPESY